MEFNEQTIREAMRIAQSAQGQQLLKLVRQRNADAVEKAINQASSGDLTSAQQLLKAMMADPNIRDLMAGLGELHE